MRATRPSRLFRLAVHLAFCALLQGTTLLPAGPAQAGPAQARPTPEAPDRRASAADAPEDQTTPTPEASLLPPALASAHQFLDRALSEDLGSRPAAFWAKLPSSPPLAASFGRYRANSRVPLASASEWLSTAGILVLVDRGQLSLDTTLGSAFPELEEDKSKIRLRQLLSHTAGLATRHPCLADRATDLTSCAQRILEAPLRAGPGKEFRHGGSSLQVAAHLVERVTGLPWAEVFQSTLAGPLELTCTSFGDSRNPAVADGARSCQEDLGRFLSMLLDGGKHRGTSVLSEESLGEMFRDQIRGAEIVFSPYAETPGYGLGVWLDGLNRDGESSRPGVRGSLGTSAWLDLDSETAALLLIIAPRNSVSKTLQGLQEELARAVPSQGAEAAGRLP